MMRTLLLLLLITPLYIKAELTASEQLESELTKLQTFEANFVQQNYAVGRMAEESTSGRFLLQRPNQFMWQTYSPFAQTITSNGEAIWTLDDDLEQVIISPLDEEIQNAPILLLAREHTDLEKLFTIEKEEEEEDNEVYYVLNPVDNSGNFERIRIGFTNDMLSVLELFDSLGQMTRITMTNVRMNPVLDPSVFSPEIPDDFDVIDSRPIPDATE